MKSKSATGWLLAMRGALLPLGLYSVHAQPPVVPEDVKTTVRQRVDYGYCPGIVVGLLNTNGPAYFSYGSVDLDGGSVVAENFYTVGPATFVWHGGGHLRPTRLRRL